MRLIGLAVPHNKSCLDGACTLIQSVDTKSKINRQFIHSLFTQQPILIGELLLCVGARYIKAYAKNSSAWLVT